MPALPTDDGDDGVCLFCQFSYLV